MRARKTKSFILIIGILAICFIIGTGVMGVSPKPANLEAFKGKSTGVVPPFINYASKDRVIFNGYFGLIVYDLEDEKVVRSIDLESIDSHYMQGSIATEILVTQDGKKIYIDNIGEGSDDWMYEYNVQWNRLRKIPYRKIENFYSPKWRYEELPTGEWSQLCSIGRDVYAGLVAEECKMDTLQVIVYNEKTEEILRYQVMD